MTHKFKVVVRDIIIKYPQGNRSVDRSYSFEMFKPNKHKVKKKIEEIIGDYYDNLKVKRIISFDYYIDPIF